MNKELFAIEESPKLKMLAIEIDALNRQTGYHINQAVVYAAKTGAKLIEAKANCTDPEGFVKWLAKNVTDIKQATAYRYMKLSTDMPWLLDDLSQKINLPSITQAIELLSASEQLQNEVLERIENGEDVAIKEIQRLKKEATDLLAEKEAVQNDLLSAKKSAENLQTMYSEANKQRNELREQNEKLSQFDENMIDSRVEERLAGERADLILENQEAIAQAKKQASDAQDALEKLEEQKQNEISALKKSQDKKVQEAIAQRFKELDAEIQEKQSIINGSKKTIDELHDVKESLNSEVGDLNIHKKSISSFMDGITQLVSEYHRASETMGIPVESINEWREINHALKGLSKELSDWINTPHTVEGELVN